MKRAGKNRKWTFLVGGEIILVEIVEKGAVSSKVRWVQEGKEFLSIRINNELFDTKALAIQRIRNHG